LEFLADTHVHVYPVHDAARLIGGAARRLRSLARSPDVALALFLTEAAGCDFFNRVRAGAQSIGPGFSVAASAELEALEIAGPVGRIWMLAGRQIIARERIEILALACGSMIPDGLPAAEAVRQVMAAGGVPVLAWAPGKWMFKRASLVQDLLQQFGPRELLLGDSSLRMTGWPEPACMRSRITVAGSDPLPFPGDEDQAGRYATSMQVAFNPQRPVSSLRAVLLDPAANITRSGHRNDPWTMVRRMLCHRRQKRATG